MILVTGATGTVGSEVIKRLSDTAQQTRAMTRRPREKSALPHVTYFGGDFDDQASVRAACEGVERAFLLTSSSERVEAQQTSFVRIARECGVRHLVVLSQLHADAKSPARFLRYHGIVEQAVHEAGIGYSILRPNLYMQGLLAFREVVRREGILPLPGGEGRVSAIDARDVADIAVHALVSGGSQNHVYALTGPESLSFAEMATKIGRARGKDVKYVEASEAELRRAVVASGMPVWQADGLIEDFATYRRGEAAGVEPDFEKSLGRAPRPFDEFARNYAAQFSDPEPTYGV